MRYVKVAAAELNQVPLDWDGNESRIRAALAEARKAGASLVCLPELCITGYGCEDAFHSPFVAETAWETLRSLLPETRGMVVTLGLPVLYRNALYNAACVIVDGAPSGPSLNMKNSASMPAFIVKPIFAARRRKISVFGAASPSGAIAGLLASTYRCP